MKETLHVRISQNQNECCSVRKAKSVRAYHLTNGKRDGDQTLPHHREAVPSF